MTHRPSRQHGYTLMELLITVSIITIVTSIALPSYQNHVMRSHRTDAMGALLRVANAQEKFYLQNNSYTGDLAELNITGTESGYYDLTIADADVNGFTATATASSGGPQENDSKCQNFTIDATGALGAGSSGVDNTTECWR
ncbi:MAG: type IV pilin protein [Gammaproteobacteria bacterium]